MITRMIFIGLFLVFSAVSGFAEEGSGTITGKWITKEYGPMTGGQVLLFNKANGPPPASHKYLRLPDQGTAIDQEGTFSVQLPTGRYYLVMRKRLDPSSAGPPLEGEPQYYARDKNGNPTEYVVKAGKTTNIGTITKVTPYRKKPVTTDGITGIEGTVTDKQGQPVAGIRVFAYETTEMKGMPRYASGATGADGKYLLVLTRKGTYFLRARIHYGGGKPEEGEFMGIYGTSEKPNSVVVEQGKMSRGIDIQVDRLSRQPGQQRAMP
ncbi:carboxypeptidase-like regulatory domain-containing protein [Geobacter sp.]|uniref:carboxypeptidase-like regulatory domain-containing protein n=1 Tax=Geobacter sp. TaxID=46610 RepID=UPI0027B93BE7|nr:carboxypeptidase-like regulatory domain-containing protein [Geobacter sp.]